MTNVNNLVNPLEQATEEDVTLWYEVQQKMKELVDMERVLRTKICKTTSFFSDPKEGTNTFKLQNGYAMKMVYKINRTVDYPLLQDHAYELKEAGINIDSIVNLRPEVRTSGIKVLTDEQKKLLSHFITEKEGTPSLEIVLTKKVTKE